MLVFIAEGLVEEAFWLVEDVMSTWVARTKYIVV